MAVKLTEEMRTRFLDLVRAKVLPMKAARQLDLNWRGVRNFAAGHTDFADDWADARAAAVEKVEERLWTAAEGGQPWAVNKVLDSYAPEVFNRPKEVKIETSGKIEHTLTGASADEVIARFAKTTDERIRIIEENHAALNPAEPVEDAEIVEDDEPKDKNLWLPDILGTPAEQPEPPPDEGIPPLPWLPIQPEKDS